MKETKSSKKIFIIACTSVIALLIIAVVAVSIFHHDTATNNSANSTPKQETTMNKNDPHFMYPSCKLAKEDGVKSMKKGDYGYNPVLDYNSDGTACDIGDRLFERSAHEDTEKTDPEALNNIMKLSQDGCFYIDDETKSLITDPAMQQGAYDITKAVAKMSPIGIEYVVADVTTEEGKEQAIWGIVGGENTSTVVSINDTSKKLTIFPDFGDDFYDEDIIGVAKECLAKSTEGETDLARKEKEAEEIRNGK